MEKLTLNIINKIINNCKDRGTIYLDCEIWEIHFINKDKEFRSYNVIHFLKDKESEDYWLIDLKEDTNIECEYYRALEGDKNFTLNDFYKKFGSILETNKEVIELVVKHEQHST